MTETDETDPLAGFAALMGAAGQDAKPVQEHPEAPYGYTVDPVTGQERPKKSPGRPRKSPTLDELKTRKDAEASEGPDKPADRPPVAPKRRRGRRASTPQDDRPAPPVPQALRYEGGIAKGINRLYRKTGKIAVALGIEPEGQALIEITRAEDPDDVTVGDAWELLCRTNPRVRAFWVRMLAGGAVGQVFMAHLPVLLAFLMREGVRRRIPFGRLLAVAVDESEGAEEAPAAGTPFAGMTQADLEAMAAMAQQAFGMAMPNGPARPADVPQRGE